MKFLLHFFSFYARVTAVSVLQTLDSGVRCGHFGHRDTGIKIISQVSKFNLPFIISIQWRLGRGGSGLVKVGRINFVESQLSANFHCHH